MCIIENLPRTIVAGEQFAMQIRVRDAFKNGLSGLEPTICLLPKDAAEATAIAKVSGTDLGKGNYVMSSKIYKSFHHFGISIHAGGKIIHSAVIEVPVPFSHSMSGQLRLSDLNCISDNICCHFHRCPKQEMSCFGFTVIKSGHFAVKTLDLMNGLGFAGAAGQGKGEKLRFRVQQ